MCAHLSRHIAERRALPDFGRMERVAARKGEAGIAVTRRRVAHAETRDLIWTQQLWRRLLVVAFEHIRGGEEGHGHAAIKPDAIDKRLPAIAGEEKDRAAVRRPTRMLCTPI